MYLDIYFVYYYIQQMLYENGNLFNILFWLIVVYIGIGKVKINVVYVIYILNFI